MCNATLSHVLNLLGNFGISVHATGQVRSSLPIISSSWYFDQNILGIGGLSIFALTARFDSNSYKNDSHKRILVT